MCGLFVVTKKMENIFDERNGVSKSGLNFQGDDFRDPGKIIMDQKISVKVWEIFNRRKFVSHGVFINSRKINKVFDPSWKWKKKKFDN